MTKEQDKLVNEALHKALKVLNCLNNDRVYEIAWVKGAINACEEALALSEKQHTFPDKKQPAQEPVAWMNDIAFSMDKELLGTRSRIVPLYIHPAPQPTHEPSCWITAHGEGFRIRFEKPDNEVTLGWMELYTHPTPSWQRLSDDEKLVRKWKDAYKIHD